jgi:hypothetical protein
MPGLLIAVVGSFDPSRETELGLKNVAIGNKAGEDLGRELARQGFRLVVFSSGANTLEIDVVRGYLSHPNTEPGSIQVRYSPQAGQPKFAEEPGNEEKFDWQPDFNPDWEFSFYQSLAHIDGMLMLGGGSWALIAGVVAMSYRKPLLPCAAFGGSADKIWRAMRVQKYPIGDADFALMARSNWSTDLAARLVALLTKQKDDFAHEEEVRLENEEKRIAERQRTELQENSRINWHAIISALLFALAVFTWPLTMFLPKPAAGSDAGRWPLCVVLFTCILAGASGATIRVVLDWATGVTRTFALSAYNQYILLRYAALGVVAGGLAGVSFVLAQIFSTQTATDKMFDALTRLVPFLIIIGFAAGLTAEVVLSNIRKSSPTVEVPVPKKKTE